MYALFPIIFFALWPSFTVTDTESNN